MFLVVSAVQQAAHVLAAASPAPSLPDLGGGAAPPGSDKIVTMLQWMDWAFFAACIAGVVLSAGRMAVQWRSHGGGGGEAMNSLVWTLIACVIGSSATAIVGALI